MDDCAVSFGSACQSVTSWDATSWLAAAMAVAAVLLVIKMVGSK